MNALMLVLALLGPVQTSDDRDAARSGAQDGGRKAVASPDRDLDGMWTIVYMEKFNTPVTPPANTTVTIRDQVLTYQPGEGQASAPGFPGGRPVFAETRQVWRLVPGPDYRLKAYPGEGAFDQAIFSATYFLCREYFCLCVEKSGEGGQQPGGERAGAAAADRGGANVKQAGAAGDTPPRGSLHPTPEMVMILRRQSPGGQPGR